MYLIKTDVYLATVYKGLKEFTTNSEKDLGGVTQTKCIFEPHLDFIDEWVDQGILVFDESDETLWMRSSKDDEIVMKVEPGCYIGYNTLTKERMVSDEQYVNDNFEKEYATKKAVQIALNSIYGMKTVGDGYISKGTESDRLPVSYISKVSLKSVDNSPFDWMIDTWINTDRGHDSFQSVSVEDIVNLLELGMGINGTYAPGFDYDLDRLITQVSYEFEDSGFHMMLTMESYDFDGRPATPGRVSYDICKGNFEKGESDDE